VQAQLDKKNSQIRKYANGGPKINKYINLVYRSMSQEITYPNTKNVKTIKPNTLPLDISESAKRTPVIAVMLPTIIISNNT
jgi:hypothetical protein